MPFYSTVFFQICQFTDAKIQYAFLQYCPFTDIPFYTTAFLQICLFTLLPFYTTAKIQYSLEKNFVRNRNTQTYFCFEIEKYIQGVLLLCGLHLMRNYFYCVFLWNQIHITFISNTVFIIALVVSKISTSFYS